VVAEAPGQRGRVTCQRLNMECSRFY
jgi:hypothetical protein